MSVQYQIIKRPIAPKGEPRCKWEFVAHGARYSEDESKRMCMSIANNGWESKRLRI